MWSAVFECDLNETPGVPARIAAAIIASLQNRVEHAIVENTRGKPSMEAYKCVLRGYAGDDNAKALSMFREVVLLNPDYPLARAYLAFGEYACEAARRVLKRDPAFKVSRLRIASATADHYAHVRAGMLKAGLPD